MRVQTHPGEVLLKDCLQPLGMSPEQLSAGTGIPAVTITALTEQRTAVTADIAHRLARFFNTTPDFWMGLQTGHDLSAAAAENDYAEITPRI